MKKLWFGNDDHKENHDKLMSLVNNNDKFVSALYVLAAIKKPDEIGEHISTEGINFAQLNEAAKHWTFSEKAVVRFAAIIFSRKLGTTN